MIGTAAGRVWRARMQRRNTPAGVRLCPLYAPEPCPMRQSSYH